MNGNPLFVPVVDCHKVLLLAQHARQLPSEEQSQLFEDLARDPDMGPVVVSEVRTYLEHHLA
jgi:hypothetical protein